MVRERSYPYFSDSVLHVILETDNYKLPTQTLVGTSEEVGQELLEILSTMQHSKMRLHLDFSHKFLPLDNMDINQLKQQIKENNFGMAILAVNLGLTTYETLGVIDNH